MAGLLLEWTILYYHRNVPFWRAFSANKMCSYSYQNRNIFKFMNKYLPVHNFQQHNQCFRPRLKKWYVPCHWASRRGRVNMASEQVRYLQYLLLFLYSTPLSAQLFIKRTIIYIYSQVTWRNKYRCTGHFCRSYDNNSNNLLVLALASLFSVMWKYNCIVG